MQDFNILNRASFEDEILELNIPVLPGQTVNHKEIIKGTFWISSATWKYGITTAQTVQDNYGVPRQPPKITIKGVFSNQSGIQKAIKPPKPCKDVINISIFNPSTLGLTLYFKIIGVRVIPKEGSFDLNQKEMLGYIMLSPEQRGMLALSEAAMDRWDTEFSKLGIQLRESLPSGQIGPLLDIIKLLPNNMKPLAMEKLMNNSELWDSNEPQALPKSNISNNDLKSILLGDIISYFKNDIEYEKINGLCDMLIDKGWKR